jgi:hypothetical protein
MWTGTMRWISPTARPAGSSIPAGTVTARSRRPVTAPSRATTSAKRRKVLPAR